ncbi:MAG: CotH kinase family protein [Bacteroidota bacterium]
MKRPRRNITIILISLLSITSISAQIAFGTQGNYKYLKGSGASTLPADWIESGFDDSGWSSASAPFRYGDGTGGTELTDMNGNYSTLFLRSTFTVEQLDLLNEVMIGADWDDGFIIWINGKEVLSQFAPTPVSYDALATSLHESGAPENFIFDASELELTEGVNTIAVFACNITLAGSSDFFFDMSIQAQPHLPGLPELMDTVGLVFSHSSGFYNNTFDLAISTSLEGVEIVYTLDGSSPQNSFTSFTGGSSVIISIDPNSTQGRDATPSVLVRASVVKDGYKASKPEARTFIFLEKVKTQTHPGGTWPAQNLTNGNLQYMDYDMDPDVVNSDQYADQMDAALLDIPSISLMTANANLFDPDSGIYVNAIDQGYDWERECSVELINPDHSDGFNLNAGLRIRGGWSRHNNYPKHAFRLFFREEYGESKLDFPLFEDEGVSEFDKIDLRCSQNYSWANGQGSSHLNTFLREVFTRDSQKDSGQPYTRSRYYHLYLNGMYWGLYQTQERSEARFAADYLGGKSEEYDVIKKSGLYADDIVATDGTLDKWSEIYEFAQSGFASDKDYFRLEGKDANGMGIPGAEVYVDIDNLIDFMINIFYTGNYDSPVSKFGNNKSPNNIFAITNREDKSSGFKFFIHDGEHTLMTGPSEGPGIGLYENRANIGDITGQYQMVVTNLNQFHTQWLHYKLTKNAEYRIRFANRAWEQLTGTGIFSPDQCIERMNKRVEQIDMAIIAESARWGDTQSSTPRTKDNAWLPQVEELRNDYFPFRANIVMEQLEELDLFPALPAPVVKGSGKEILDPVENFTSSMEITLNNQAAVGDLYYTLDGSDPRKIGGGISALAVKIASGGSINIRSSSILKARIVQNNSWSAVTEVTFVTEQTDYSDFKVTEPHYHPLDSIDGTDTISGKSFEFIEFRNIDPADGMNLSGLVMDSAIYYEFPENHVLAPRQYFVIASKPTWFYSRYGREPSGNFQNNLSNSGEQVVVHTAGGEVILDITYDDHLPWPEQPDGNGPSLISAESDPDGDPNDYFYWTASSVIHGTPFYHDRIVGTDEIIMGEDLNKLKIYPNPTDDLITVQWSSVVAFSYTLSIYDLRGTICYRGEFSDNAEVSFSALNISHGIYLVEIVTPAGKEIQKVIYTP